MRLLTFSDDLGHPGLELLVDSATDKGWDILVLSGTWKGFGTKLIEVYNYLKKNPDVESFVFIDAHDVIVLGNPEEFVNKIPDRSKIWCSVEVGCWPVAENASKYPDTNHKWKYINSGAYYAPSELFINLMEENRPTWTDDDQLWMQERYFENPAKFILDYNCEGFQSYSFIDEDDFEYKDGRLVNLKTGALSCIFHGNGKTDMTKIIELL